MVLRTNNGYPEMVVASECNVSIFYATANWLREKFGIAFNKIIEQDEQISWEFFYEATLIVLNFDSVNGIQLYPFHQQRASDVDKVAFNKFVKVLKSL